jgi:tripartite-type tricarboxylate transporter receptor subunit TctC
MIRHAIRLALLLAVSALMAGAVLLGTALAQPAAREPARDPVWPLRPIRLIAPFPPASTVDVIARILGQKLSARLGQQLVIDNRAGASGNIAPSAIAKAAPDGYARRGDREHAGDRGDAGPQFAYDPTKDFTPIAMIARAPHTRWWSTPDCRPKRRRPHFTRQAQAGALSYGSAGPASLAHLAGALFATSTDIALTHVPYKSSAQSVVDLISGRLDMQFATIAPTLANIRAGQLRALAVTSKNRVEALPEVPTMDAAGVPGYDAVLWFALVGPAGLPANIAARLNHEVIDVLNSPDMKATLEQQGFVGDAGTPQALTDQVRRDIVKWREVIPKAGIKGE